MIRLLHIRDGNDATLLHGGLPSRILPYTIRAEPSSLQKNRSASHIPTNLHLNQRNLNQQVTT